MPEDVTINNELGIIEIDSYGDITEEILYTSVKKIKQIRGKTGINKVLVDTTGQSSMPSAISLYTFGNNIPHLFKYAIVVSEMQSTKKDQDFFEAVAINRGFKVQEFITKDEAIEWLNS